MVVAQNILPMFDTVIFLTERIPYIIAAQAVLVMVVRKPFRVWVVLSLPLFLLSAVSIAFFESQKNAREEGYDMTQMSVREALEGYISTGEGDLQEMVAGKKYPPIFGKTELMRYVKQQTGSWFHNTEQDSVYMPESYNKGDDWFEAFLSAPMVYTGDIHSDPGKESMWDTQYNKLEYIMHVLGVKPGHRAMDIGCGWGRLTNHYAGKGAKATGITLSTDQLAYAKGMTEKLGNTKNADFVLKNFFDLEYAAKSFDVISAVEMAEHVGIRNYHSFLRKVHHFLKDDGVFYIQVAGLQRGYAEGYNNYNELVWGMFMDEHVFPGADASTPMGWVLEKLEKAGFEVQSSLNLGTHYTQTIDRWRAKWNDNKDRVVKVYGERSWRRWNVFLTWAVQTGWRGGSTVQMIVAMKSGATPNARKATQERIAPGNFQIPAKVPYPGGGPDF